MEKDIKNKVIDIGIGTLVGIISSIVSTTIIAMSFLSDIDKRISILEERQEHKVDTEDFRVLKVKLDTMEALLLEIKKEIKNN